MYISFYWLLCWTWTVQVAYHLSCAVTGSKMINFVLMCSDFCHWIVLISHSYIHVHISLSFCKQMNALKLFCSKMFMSMFEAWRVVLRDDTWWVNPDSHLVQQKWSHSIDERSWVLSPTVRQPSLGGITYTLLSITATLMHISWYTFETCMQKRVNGTFLWMYYATLEWCMFHMSLKKHVLLFTVMAVL